MNKIRNDTYIIRALLSWCAHKIRKLSWVLLCGVISSTNVYAMVNQEDNLSGPPLATRFIFVHNQQATQDTRNDETRSIPRQGGLLRKGLRVVSDLSLFGSVVAGACVLNNIATTYYYSSDRDYICDYGLNSLKAGVGLASTSTGLIIIDRLIDFVPWLCRYCSQED